MHGFLKKRPRIALVRAARGETLATAASLHLFLSTSPPPECATGRPKQQTRMVAAGPCLGDALSPMRRRRGEAGRPVMALACGGGGSVCGLSDLTLHDRIWWSLQKSNRPSHRLGYSVLPRCRKRRVRWS
ncbi:hypothetical protein BDA96_10G270100 [Sorghum bicolor]|uniref:Uncharacterized protein n=1 Tax=Sorghum bicolor TaxID=4558 RepID=A0A921Q4B5_SORBI|nr:hypothetical protein BDA96_10G270100 [Sorghum bicolor]